MRVSPRLNNFDYSITLTKVELDFYGIVTFIVIQQLAKLIMAVNITKNKESLVKAYQDVLDSNTKTDW